MQTPPGEPYRPPPTPPGTVPEVGPGAGAAPAAPMVAPAVPRGRRGRLIVALVGGVLALLCLGGGVVAFTLYDNATTIDRTSPSVVAFEYTSDLLVNRDPRRAELWTCDGAQVAAAERLLDDIVATEKRLKTAILVNAESFKVRELSEQKSEVKLDIRRSATVNGVHQSVTDPLTVTVEDRDGWRVCAVTAP